VDSPVVGQYYPTVTANSNTIYSSGPCASGVPFGIGFWSGATGSADGNTIYNDPLNDGYALNVWGSHPVSFTNNTVTNVGEVVGGLGAQLIESTNLIFTNNRIEYQALAGAITYSATATITGNTITNCTDGFIVDWETSGAVVTMHSNSFTGIATDHYAVKVGGPAGEASGTDWGDWTGPSTVTVDATNNWWGSESGPTHAGNTFHALGSGPIAQGGAVSGNVLYCPWLNAWPGGTSFAPVNNTTRSTKFSSIQAAINDAATVAGDNITAAAGTYDESVTINKKNNLQLLGAKAGIPAGPEANPAGRSLPSEGSIGESIINGKIVEKKASGSTIDGFTILSAGQHGISPISGDVIRNNIIDGGPGSTKDGISSAGGGHLITHNNIRNCFRGMMFDGNASAPQCEISGNYIANASFGIVAMGSWSNGHIFSYNTIENSGAGIHLGQGGHEVSHNTIRNNTGSGIYILAGPEMPSRTFGIQITYNTIEENGTGIELAIYPDSDDAGAINNQAHFNNIVGNTNGVLNNHTAEFDATSNWWGDASGPYNADTNALGTGNSVSNNVDYSPWWGDNYIGVAHPWSWYTNDFIQDAVDAASDSDNVNVLPGKYNESVTIYKSLTVASSTNNWHDVSIDLGEAVLRLVPEGGAPSFTDNVTISGLTLSGADYGIYIQGLTEGNTININNCLIYNNGTGIYASGTLDGDISINNCIIAQNGVVTGIHLEQVEGAVEIRDSFIGAYWDAEAEEGEESYLGNAGDGIAIDIISEDGTVLIDNNKIVGNGGNGIADRTEGCYGELTITNNIIGAYDYDLTYENGDFFGGNGDNGILIDHVGDTGVINIDGNKIAQNTQDGIRFGGFDTVYGDVTINNNLIGAWTQDDGVNSHQYAGNGSEGIYVSSVATDGSMTITNNKIAENGLGTVETGIYIVTTSGDTTISGNYVGSWTQDVPGGAPVTYNGNGGPGILIDNVEDNTVTIQNNTIDKNNEGIFLRKVSETSTVAITGNTITNNVSEAASGIDLLSDVHTDNVTINFNNIFGNQTYGIYKGGSTDNVDAENNWWGNASGPYHPTTNPSGTGDNVTDLVDYDPWLGVPITGGTTKTVGPGGGTVDAKDEADTEVDVTGTATVTVAEYSSNPGSGFNGDTGKYIDVHIANTDNVTQIEIRLYYTPADIAGPPALNEATLRLRWWNGTGWIVCSDSGVETRDILPWFPPYSGYMWAKIRNDTTPNLTQLTGTAFGGGGVGAGGGGGGGGGGGVVPTITGLVGPSLTLDYQGIIQATCRLKTVDGKLTLDIAKGTRLLDSLGRPLTSLSAALEPAPPAPPSGAAIIVACNLGLNGATFSPAITLTIEYDPASLPKNVAEKDLYIAYWDGSKWLALKSTVDTTAHTASCELSHFTIFAIIGTITPPAPAAFSASNLSIQPLEVKPKEAVTITLSVANTGGTEGSYPVLLKINGIKEAEKSVTVAPGKSQSVSFSVTKEQAGSYNVTVDGLSSSFTVAAPPAPPPSAAAPPPAKPPITWPLIGGIIAGVVIAGLIVFFLVRRRAY